MGGSAATVGSGRPVCYPPAMAHDDPGDPAFWRARWREGRCGWHKDHVNEKLLRYVDRLRGGPSDRVLVPLCGASLDLGFLARQGFAPVGVEVAPEAVAALFPEATPDAERGTVHEGAGTTVVCGDFFTCDLSPWAPFGAFYDRGALVALPPRRHAAYAARLADLAAPGARGLLVTVEYDGPADVGPPFSVDAAAVSDLFGAAFEVTPLERVEDAEMPGRFEELGVTGFSEAAYHLVRADR